MRHAQAVAEPAASGGGAGGRPCSGRPVEMPTRARVQARSKTRTRIESAFLQFVLRIRRIGPADRTAAAPSWLCTSTVCASLARLASAGPDRFDQQFLLFRTSAQTVGAQKLQRSSRAWSCASCASSRSHAGGGRQKAAPRPPAALAAVCPPTVRQSPAGRRKKTSSDLVRGPGCSQSSRHAPIEPTAQRSLVPAGVGGTTAWVLGPAPGGPGQRSRPKGWSQLRRQRVEGTGRSCSRRAAVEPGGPGCGR